MLCWAAVAWVGSGCHPNENPDGVTDTGMPPYMPMSQFWKAGTPMTSNIMDGIQMLFGHGYWYFGVMILLVSVILPLTKLLGLTWFLLSIRFGWSQHLRFKPNFLAPNHASC